MASRTYRRSPEMTMWNWLIFILPSTCGLNVISSVSHYHAVQGVGVNLGCDFTLAPEELDFLDIKWTFRPPDSQEKLLLWYEGHSVVDLSGSKGRIHFDMLPPQDGDASLILQNLKLADTGTYRCKVKTSTGVESSTMQLTVIKEVPKPKCGVSGNATVGNDVMLHCGFPEDTESRGFSWKKISGDGMFPRFSSLDKTRGDLYIKDLKTRDAGTYRCTAGSPFSVEHCDVFLQTKSSKSTASSVVTPTVIFIIIVIISILVLNITVIIACVRRIKRGNKTMAVTCLPHEDFAEVSLIPERPIYLIPTLHVFGLWEEAGEPGENPRTHGENMQTRVFSLQGESANHYSTVWP